MKQIYQVVPEEFPIAVTCSEKFLFIVTYNWVVLAVLLSVKYFFAPHFPIFQKSCIVEEQDADRQLQSVILLIETQSSNPHEISWSHHDETCNSFTLAEEDPKNIQVKWNTPWVPLIPVLSIQF